jgi:hypothetical protein
MMIYQISIAFYLLLSTAGVSSLSLTGTRSFYGSLTGLGKKVSSSTLASTLTPTDSPTSATSLSSSDRLALGLGLG